MIYHSVTIAVSVATVSGRGAGPAGSNGRAVRRPHAHEPRRPLHFGAFLQFGGSQLGKNGRRKDRWETGFDVLCESGGTSSLLDRSSIDLRGCLQVWLTSCLIREFEIDVCEVEHRDAKIQTRDSPVHPDMTGNFLSRVEPWLNLAHPRKLRGTHADLQSLCSCSQLNS